MWFSREGELFFERHAQGEPDGIVPRENVACGISFSPVEQRNIPMERQTD